LELPYFDSVEERPFRAALKGYKNSGFSPGRFSFPITAIPRDHGDYGDLFPISVISENQW